MGRIKTLSEGIKHMIEIYYGNDRERKKMEIVFWVDSKKKLGYQVEKYEQDTISLENIEQSLLGGGLFGTKTAFVFYYVDILREAIKLFDKLPVSIKGDSHMLFVFGDTLDGEDIPTEIVVKNFSKNIQHDDIGKKVFDLADAIGRRDKKNTWLLYRQIIESDIDPLQGIYSPLVWSLNNITLVHRDPKSAHGMKPYPLQKAREFAKNYTKDEIDSLLEELLFLYQMRREGEDIEAKMEEILLRIV